MSRGTNQNKKAVSLMISYVILISLGIIIATSAYSWIKHYPEIIQPPVDCKDGTSVILVGYNSSDNILRLYLKNNGFFSIDGIILQVENDTKKEPTKTLHIVDGENPLGQLNPGEIKNVNYTIEEGVAVLKIQPYILDENDKMIICMQSIIREDNLGMSGGEEPPEEPPEQPTGEPVFGCSTLDSPNTNYILMNNINNNSISDFRCIIITAQNITFDCQSYDNYIKILAEGIGIYSNSAETKIENCNISVETLNNDGAGIKFDSDADNSFILNNILNGNYYGMKIYSDYNLIQGNTIINSDYRGIQVYASTGNKIIGNNISNNNRGVYIYNDGADINLSNNFICYNPNDDIWCNYADIYGEGNKITNLNGGCPLGEFSSSCPSFS